MLNQVYNKTVSSLVIQGVYLRTTTSKSKEQAGCKPFPHFGSIVNPKKTTEVFRTRLHQFPYRIKDIF